MKTLLFDTETTTLPNDALSPEDPNQARIMQLAMMLMNDDKEIAVYKSLVMPNNWGPVHPKAYEAHRLTIEQCDEFGVNIDLVLQMFGYFYELCDVAVAFNKDFDIKLLEIEYCRQAGVMPRHKPYYCAMKPMTTIVGLKQEGSNRPKWPKLKEAYKFVTGEELEGAHDALSDVRGTGKVWSYIIQNGIVTVN